MMLLIPFLSEQPIAVVNCSSSSPVPVISHRVPKIFWLKKMQMRYIMTSSTPRHDLKNKKKVQIEVLIPELFQLRRWFRVGLYPEGLYPGGL